MTITPAGSQARLPRGLFLNTAKANCSIHESGRMAFDCLRPSDRFQLDYAEVHTRSIEAPEAYDFYVFNYHFVTMGCLDTKTVRSLPGLKMTLVLETLPNNPFVYCAADDFDLYLALDPTMDVPDPRVVAFPRPLEVTPPLPPYEEGSIPSIGSFGFATVGKGFELVVDAVNREFDQAIIRLNIPPSTFADGANWHIHQRPYAEYLSELCRSRARPGIQVDVTHHYFDKPDLVRWCARNTLNCFLYDRNMPGLAATTDQAVVSGRPLAISVNDTFRHIGRYLKPYPEESLRGSIDHSIPNVLRMREDWSPGRFLGRFEDLLESRAILTQELAQEIRPVDVTPPARRRVLLVNHRAARCGIHEYGLNLHRAFSKSGAYDVRYAECSSAGELEAAVQAHGPEGILYNHYPATLPWLTPEIVRRQPGVSMGVLHETTQEAADAATGEWFQAVLCPDPTLEERNPVTFRLQRLIPTYVNTQPLSEIPVFGSFGFGIADKGFERVIDQVQREFDRAVIRLHMPFNDVVDPDGAYHARHTADRCRAAVRKPGIELVITHDFKPLPELLDLLGSCHLNAFFYNVDKHRGISSVIEHALAVQRPLAINRCGMFRHVLDARPSICIEDRSLREILDEGIAPLGPFLERWSESSFVSDTERVLTRIFEK